MGAFVIEQGTIKLYKGTEKAVRIPREIRIIGEDAFSGATVEDVSFEDDLLRIIGDRAFNNCKHLKSLTLPKKLMSIGDNAFCGCSELESIYIPQSVVDIGTCIIDSTMKCLIAGEKGSYAETYARENNLVFVIDSQRNNAQINLSGVNDYDIFGVKVSCSKNHMLYTQNKVYYEQRKAQLFDDIYGNLPVSYDSEKKPNIENLKALSDDVVRRLAVHGVLTTTEKVYIHTATAFSEVANAIVQYYEAVKMLADGMNQDISEMREAVDRAAQSQITGVNYGVIGGPLDMFLYSLDNALAARKQYYRAKEEADEANRVLTEKIRRQAELRLKTYKRESKPIFEETINNYIEAVYKAESILLSEAGLMSYTLLEKIDEDRSDRILSRIKETEEDIDSIIGLSLKYNPYNAQAYYAAFRNNTVPEELLDMLFFIMDGGELTSLAGGVVGTYAKGYISSKQDCNHYVDSLVYCERLLSDSQKQDLINTFNDRINSYEKRVILNSLNSDIDSYDYCEPELEKIVSRDSVSTVIEFCKRNDIRNLFCSYMISSFDMLLESWANKRNDVLKAYGNCEHVSDEDYDNVEKELKYQNAVQLLRNLNGEEEIDQLINMLLQLKDYKNGSVLFEQAQALKYEDDYSSCAEIIKTSNNEQRVIGAIKKLKSMKNYRSSSSLIEIAENRLHEIQAEDLKRKAETVIDAQSLEGLKDQAKSLYRSTNVYAFKEIIDYIETKEDKGIISEFERLAESANRKEDLLDLRQRLFDNREKDGFRQIFEKVDKKYKSIQTEEMYKEAIIKIDSMSTMLDYYQIRGILNSIDDYKNSKDLLVQIERKKDELLNNAYFSARSMISDAKSYEDYRRAMDILREIPSDYKNSHDLYLMISKGVEEMKAIDEEITKLEEKASQYNTLFQRMKLSEIRTSIEKKKANKRLIAQSLLTKWEI